MIDLDKAINKELTFSFLEKAGVKLFLKRLDRIHPEVQGNKFFKLKYNLEKARELGHKTILTFGGAWSNHIFSTAAAGKEFGFETIGVIRGEEPAEYSDTLKFARGCGMKLQFVSRAEYREKNEDYFKAWLRDLHGSVYIIPEGGSNFLGVNGCMEILEKEDVDYDLIATSCGTGATLSGIVLSLKDNQKAWGFPALKGGEFLREEINSFTGWTLGDPAVGKEFDHKFDLITDYHFGGFAKTTPHLLAFMKEFEDTTGIPLDPIYTGKMMYGLLELIAHGKVKSGTKILAIHTGGLQGRMGKELNAQPEMVSPLAHLIRA
ncbi:1-aminocyclopropane-1-carboxylate deaminase/D-cysteine desulfhydrase [Halocola ammonii]